MVSLRRTKPCCCCVKVSLFSSLRHTALFSIISILLHPRSSSSSIVRSSIAFGGRSSVQVQAIHPARPIRTTTNTPQPSNPTAISSSSFYSFSSSPLLSSSSLLLYSPASSSLMNTNTTTTTTALMSTTTHVCENNVNHHGNDEEEEEDTMTTTTTTLETLTTGYLDAASAYALDQDLMRTSGGFALEQLMELAGLSVAQAVYQVLHEEQDQQEQDLPQDIHSIIVVCGPGNNGGDGLVAARHLVHFGFRNVTVVYPKPNRQQHAHFFANLVQQCRDLNIAIRTDLPPVVPTTPTPTTKVAIVDAIFGFSFRAAGDGGDPNHPPIIREPFATLLQQIMQWQQESARTTTVFSVDVPSGWNVDEDDTGASMAMTTKTKTKNTTTSSFRFLQPDVLISLTAPKLCAQSFPGRHFIGGRFLPPHLGRKYNVRMPEYPGVSQVVEVFHNSNYHPNHTSSKPSSTPAAST